MTSSASLTITPVRVADLLAQDKRVPVYGAGEPRCCGALVSRGRWRYSQLPFSKGAELVWDGAPDPRG